MAQQFVRVRLAVLIAAIVTLAGCDDNRRGSWMGGGVVSAPSATMPVRISPFQLQLAPLTTAGCPASQPFATHFDLIAGPAAFDLFIDAVTLRFGDTLAFSPLFLTSDDLQRLLGTAPIPAGTTRTFTLSPQFGCGLSTPPRSIVVTVTFVDRQGQRQEATATAMLR